MNRNRLGRIISVLMSAVMLTGQLGDCRALAGGGSLSDETEIMLVEDGKSSEISDTTYTYGSQDYKVDYSITSHWDGHCNIVIDITNTSDITIHNWNLAFCTDDKINNIYDARLVYPGDEEEKRIFRNLGYNQDIAPGGTVKFGFQVSYGESFDLPKSFYMSTSNEEVALSRYTVEKYTESSWGSGSIGALKLINKGGTTIEDWVLTIQSDVPLIKCWPVDIKESGEGIYEIECPAYDQNIDPDEIVTINYQAEGSDPDITVLGIKERNALGGFESSASLVTTDPSDASGNSASGDTGLDDPETSEDASVNKVNFEVSIDSEQFEKLTFGDYYIDSVVTSFRGSCISDKPVNTLSVKSEDMYDDIVWEGDILSDDGYRTWHIEDAGFVPGGNTFTFTAVTADNETYEYTFTVFNTEMENMKNTYVSMTDTDGDGLMDYAEKFYNTDPEKADTDGDTFGDLEEIFVMFLDPVKTDTDDDGIPDPDDDNDEDGLTVSEEYAYGISDMYKDTDGDGLDDGYEVKVSFTDPAKYDTDDDGMDDDTEIKLKLDPLKKDSDGDGIEDGSEMISQTMSESISEDSCVRNVSVSLSCSGNIADKCYITTEYGIKDIVKASAGLVGVPVNIDVNTPFNTAEIVFTYDDTKLGTVSESSLCMARYNDKDKSFELLEDSVTDTEANTVSFVTTHFSDYFLVDKNIWLSAMGQKIDYMTYDVKVKENYDFIVFIDYTVSAKDLAVEQDIAAGVIDQMQPGDRLLFLYLKNDTVYQKTSGGSRIWSTTKQGAMNNIDPNDIWTYFRGGGLSPTGGYNACIEQALRAVNYIGEKQNKQLIYLIYPGTKYDQKLTDNYTLMNDNTQIIKNKGDVVNGISIYDNVSTILNKYVAMTGGRQYKGSNAEIFNAISTDLSGRLEKSEPYIDTTDSDGDGLYDVYETRGMKTPNGRIVYTDPNSQDSDNDGIGDRKEMGLIDKDCIFHWESDPNSGNNINYVKSNEKYMYVDDMNYLPLSEKKRFLIYEKDVSPATYYSNGKCVAGLDNVWGCNPNIFDDDELTDIMSRAIVQASMAELAGGDISMGQGMAPYYQNGLALAGQLLHNYIGNTEEKYIMDFSKYYHFTLSKNVRKTFEKSVYEIAKTAIDDINVGETKIIAISPHKDCGSIEFDIWDPGLFSAIHSAEIRTIAKISYDGEMYIMTVGVYISDYYDWDVNIDSRFPTPNSVSPLEMYKLCEYGGARFYQFWGYAEKTMTWNKKDNWGNSFYASDMRTSFSNDVFY
ncbi:MAG: cellulose binding domain-containing protein [Lachnospiraceae bacterium]|nr:cellulose binding domain-containing protein [Lachnospiraceae bacterium]